jgi:hypothetical protein
VLDRSGLISKMRSPWVIVIYFAFIGAALPSLIYAVSHIEPVEGFFESRGGWVLLLCPPYFLSTVFDHTVASEKIETIVSISFANSVLYIFVGLAFATIRRDLSKHKKVANDGTEE